LADGKSNLSGTVPLGPAARTKICVLVIGMHRSGTSALTRVLNLLGTDLPKILIGSGPGNESGHWEPQRIVLLNDRLLSEAGSSWDDWSRFDLSKLAPERITEYKAELGRLLREDCGDSSLFVIKDPRIARLLPLVREVGLAENIDIRVALVFRNPIEVVDSLEKRKETWTQGYTRADAALLWLRHMLDAEAASRDITRVIVSYDGLLKDWRSCVGRLLDGLHIPLPPPSVEVAANIEAFLSASQRHHQHTINDVRLDPSMKTWVADAYEALQLLEAESKADTAFQTLNRVGDQFDSAESAIRLLLSDAKTQHTRVTDALRKTLAGRDAETLVLREQVAALQEKAVLRKAEQAEAGSFDLLAQLMPGEVTWRKFVRRLANRKG